MEDTSTWKVWMFLWRLSKHSLPTEDVRSHRNMSNTSSCGLCGSPVPGGILCWNARCLGVFGPWLIENWHNNLVLQLSRAPNINFSQWWKYYCMQILSNFWWPCGQFGGRDDKLSMKGSSKAHKLLTLPSRGSLWNWKLYGISSQLAIQKLQQVLLL